MEIAKLQSGLREQSINDGQKHRAMSTTGLLLMRRENEIVFENRHTLPCRGCFNGKDFHH
jgi:hypothetical protein